MDRHNMSAVQNFDIREAKIGKVTISNDRAEVVRIVEATLEPGFNEIVLKNVSHLLYTNSLRVKGVGDAKIHDVVVKKEAALIDDSDTEKIADLRSTVKYHKKSLDELQDRKSIYIKQIETLNGMLNELGKGVLNPPNNCGSLEVSSQTMRNVDSFLDSHMDTVEKHMRKVRQIDNKIDELKELGCKAESDLNKHETGTGSRTVTNAYITLESTSSCQIVLEVTYQVHNASWTPFYDLRVDTELSKMNLTYYAKIRQHTGEDWSNAPLILTTAQHYQHVQVPRLGTLNVFVDTGSWGAHPTGVMFGTPASTGGLFGAVPQAPRREMPVAVASNVQHSVLHTEFSIEREATIPNATDEHRVTIGIVDLESKFNHQSVPSKNPVAFLIASTRNTSALPLLAGDATIFIDGTFVAKTRLSDVSPGEHFVCSLGVDTAIRIDYKPVKKYRQQVGMFTKHSCNAVEQDIVIKNTRKSQPILITIQHHVPRSNDESVKIALVSPEVENDRAPEEKPETPKPGAIRNSMHNLEWTVELDPNSSKTLQIKYLIEHPNGEKIGYNEVF